MTTRTLDIPEDATWWDHVCLALHPWLPNPDWVPADWPGPDAASRSQEGRPMSDQSAGRSSWDDAYARFMAAPEGDSAVVEPDGAVSLISKEVIRDRGNEIGD